MQITYKNKWLVLFLLYTTLTVNAQIVINSRFKPLSFEELMLSAQAEAARNAYNKQRFEEWQDKAYAALNRGDKNGFITYSNYALQTGWYNANLYYDRGKVFQSLGNYKYAKREYKKAKRKGYYLANYALQDLKNKQRNK